ncbi:hypothetical protein ACIREE_38375 [Streptomyces sp. NPDC102467]|uniref:hypothetical protein n=1 Tax=Streptomyces sp. NPDC102467 TaxID=3366179 RepID=UPI0038179B1C
MSSDPWKDLASSLTRLHDVYYADHVKMVTGPDFWTADSPAAVESAQEPYAQVWGAAPTRDATMNVMLPVAAALDHLAALATLLTSPATVYAPFTVARSAIDIAVQVWYALEPGIGARERAVRHVNSRLRSLCVGGAHLFRSCGIPVPRRHGGHVPSPVLGGTSCD